MKKVSASHAASNFWLCYKLDFNICQGNLMPAEVSQPSLVDDEEDEPPVNKGKRKASSE